MFLLPNILLKTKITSYRITRLHVLCCLSKFFPKYTIVGGTSASEENKELNQLHSAERDSDITKTKSTLPSVFSVDSRNANGRTLLMNAAIYGNV